MKKILLVCFLVLASQGQALAGLGSQYLYWDKAEEIEKAALAKGYNAQLVLTGELVILFPGELNKDDVGMVAFVNDKSLPFDCKAWGNKKLCRTQLPLKNQEVEEAKDLALMIGGIGVGFLFPPSLIGQIFAGQAANVALAVMAPEKL